MNARSLASFCKGAIFNTHDANLGVSDMVKASLRFRFFAMPGSFKVRPFATQQGSPLLGFGFFGCHFAESGLTNFFSRFWRSDVFAVLRHVFSMPFKQMLLLRQAFKVFHTIVRFVSIDVVNLFGWVKRLKPTSSHNAVHQPLATKRQIPHVVSGGRVRLELSENFSTTRYGVEMVEESVLDSVNFDANHVVPSKVVEES